MDDPYSYASTVQNEGGGGGIYSLHYRVQSQKQRGLFSFDELVGKGLDNNLEKI